eukprot:5722718-Amphidinium_carterae.1
MVELFAPVLIQRPLPELLRNKRALLMMDSGAALGALVKGYSAKYDTVYQPMGTLLMRPHATVVKSC